MCCLIFAPASKDDTVKFVVSDQTDLERVLMRSNKKIRSRTEMPCIDQPGLWKDHSGRYGSLYDGEKMGDSQNADSDA